MSSDDVRSAVSGYGVREDRPSPPPDPGRRRRRVIAAALAGAVVAATTVALLVAKSDREEREAAQLRRDVAAERVRLTRLQAPHEGRAFVLRPATGADRSERLEARAALVRAVERRITTDARSQAAEGELDGPILRTECGPIARRPDAVPDDRLLTKRIGRYDCVAVKTDVVQDGKAVGRLGHAYVAALDFDHFTYVYCRNTPPQSERGEVLVHVRLDRRCLAATGAALGTGYVNEDPASAP